MASTALTSVKVAVKVLLARSSTVLIVSFPHIHC